MAICKICKKDMANNKTITCVGDNIRLKPGKIFKRIKYETQSIAKAFDELHKPVPEDVSRWRCHDCNIKPGNYHHFGCDMERCPKCGGQLISCGCWG